MERKILHFASSRRCAVVFAAPGRNVIRVNGAKSATGEGVENTLCRRNKLLSRQAREMNF